MLAQLSPVWIIRITTQSYLPVYFFVPNGLLGDFIAESQSVLCYLFPSWPFNTNEEKTNFSGVVERHCVCC